MRRSGRARASRRWRRVSRPLGCAALLTLLTLSTLLTLPALANSARGQDWRWETTGAVRALGSAMGTLGISGLPATMAGADDLSWSAASVVRGIVVGRGERTRVELNVFVDGSRSPGFGSVALSTVGGRRSVYRSPWLEGRPFVHQADSGAALATTIGLDRLLIRHRLGSWTLSVGRMPVSWSVTSLFTPNDFFAPFSASSINRVYKPGVDAAELVWSTGTMSSVALLVVSAWRPGKTYGEVPNAGTWSTSQRLASLDGAGVLLRGSTLLGNFQVSALAGRLPTRAVVGVTAQGDVGAYNLRLEGHGALTDDPAAPYNEGAGGAGWRDRLQARIAAGFDTRWRWRNAALMVEGMFLSDGATRPAAYLVRAQRLAADDLTQLGRWYVAAGGGVEILPIVRFGGFAMVNVADASAIAGLSLAWNVADELDLNLGALIPWGADARMAPLSEAYQLPGTRAGLGGTRGGGATGTAPQALIMESEFGAGAAIGYLEARWYF